MAFTAVFYSLVRIYCVIRVAIVLSRLTSFVNSVNGEELYATRNWHLRQIVHLHYQLMVVSHYALVQLIFHQVVLHQTLWWILFHLVSCLLSTVSAKILEKTNWKGS